MVYAQLKRLSLFEPMLESVAVELGRFVGVADSINDYEQWRLNLNNLADSLISRRYCYLVEAVVSLINWVSYGAITTEHLARSNQLALESMSEISPHTERN